MRLCLILLLLGPATFAQDSVFVTSSHPTLAPGNLRLQLLSGNSGTELFLFGVQKFPAGLRGFKTGRGEKISHAEITTHALASLDTVYQAQLRYTKFLGFSLPDAKSFKRSKEIMLHGKKVSTYIQNQWISLGTLPPSTKPVRTRGWWRTTGIFTGTKLPVGELNLFPVLDKANCVPVPLRYFELRKLQGYGIDKFPIERYAFTMRENIRKEFYLYFEQGKATPDSEGVEALRAYLENNPYAIRAAQLEGGYSPEGDSLVNQVLQRKRAAVLAKILHRYNDHHIQRDTLVLTGPWAEFRRLIKSTELAWLDTLTNASIYTLLNSNANLREQAEPWLKPLRRAKLKLVLVHKFSHDEHLQNVERDLIVLQKNLFTNEGIRKESERRLAGVLTHLLELFVRHDISSKEMRELFDRQPYRQELYMLTGYLLLKQCHDGKWLQHQQLSWVTYWQKHQLLEWFLAGENALIELYSSSTRNQESRYQRLMVDYQNFRQKFTQQLLLPAHVVCTDPYLNGRKFEIFRLHHYAMLYLLENEGFTLCNNAENSQDEKTDFPHFKEFDASPKHAAIITPSLRPIRFSYTPKTYYAGSESPYYSLLKAYFLRNRKDFMRYFESADDHALAEGLNEFNLLHLFAASVDNWNPESNHWLDPEIGLREMHSLMLKLRAIGGGICPQQLNACLLSYYQKSLRYLYWHGELGNPLHAQVADYALKFISGYYQKHMKTTTPEMRLAIFHQLNLYNWLPGEKAGAWYAAQLMFHARKSIKLSIEEEGLFERYTFLYGARKGLRKNARRTLEELRSR